jgi:hypothetical protein
MNQLPGDQCRKSGRVFQRRSGLVAFHLALSGKQPTMKPPYEATPPYKAMKILFIPVRLKGTGHGSL